MGDNLEILVKESQKWFKDNDIEIPKLAKEWQKCSVRRGEIPPGTSVGKLRNLKVSQKKFITLLNNKEYKESHVNRPITKENMETILGLRHISEYLDKEHKKVNILCVQCQTTDSLDYGTLKRMESRTDKYCATCRGVGGKPKDIKIYNKFSGFIALECANEKVTYKCTTCSNTIRRSLTHVYTAEYIVCEYCDPRRAIGCKVETEYGSFDSKFESLCYEKLLELLDCKEIQRQVKYNDLFNTGTKHTADFYIPVLNLVLEVTTKSNNIGIKYHETLKWKLSLSNSIKVAYSLQEVEDIVRAALKSVD